MSMFRRPTDDSSESEPDPNGTAEEEEEEEKEDDDIHNRSSAPSHAGNEEILGSELAATETLSRGGDVSVGFDQDVGTIQNANHHRNMILASLLEEFYRTRAAELFNTATPGARYHRQSPEIQPLARNLFAQASQDLASAGIVPSSTASEGLRSVRQQYLIGFDNLGLQNLKTNNLVPESSRPRVSYDQEVGPLVQVDGRQGNFISNLKGGLMQELEARTNPFSMLAHPSNDLQLSTRNLRRSHYHSSFRESRLLGKGGFGRVYQSFNYFDQREYAIKKIPLSPKLSQRYRERGHAELNHILREVQALAQLDHCNVVRYHATWIEEPAMIENVGSSFRTIPRLVSNGRLLDDKPASSLAVPMINTPPQRPDSIIDDGIVFAADSNASIDVKRHLEWPLQPENRQLDQSSLASSALFTDGALRRSSEDKVVDHSHCYVLHVQMSMYPLTLAQYLQPSPANHESGSRLSFRRHCYHLVPSLRILLGILSGLAYVHARGLIHRDIKPSNVFLAVDDRSTVETAADGWYDVGSCAKCAADMQPCFVNPRIGDFGLVADLAHKTECFSGYGSTSSDVVVGTQYYHPPVSGGKTRSKSSQIIDEKLDVYALGVILVEMICQCATSMQRLDLLNGLQHHRLPAELDSLLATEGNSPTTVGLVMDLIHGMIDGDSHARWTCASVKKHIEEILGICTSSLITDNVNQIDHVSGLRIS